LMCREISFGIEREAAAGSSRGIYEPSPNRVWTGFINAPATACGGLPCISHLQMYLLKFIMCTLIRNSFYLVALLNIIHRTYAETYPSRNRCSTCCLTASGRNEACSACRLQLRKCSASQSKSRCNCSYSRVSVILVIVRASVFTPNERPS